jgi:hypothetical protein
MDIGAHQHQRVSRKRRAVGKRHKVRHCGLTERLPRHGKRTGLSSAHLVVDILPAFRLRAARTGMLDSAGGDETEMHSAMEQGKIGSGAMPATTSAPTSRRLETLDEPVSTTIVRPRRGWRRLMMTRSLAVARRAPCGCETQARAATTGYGQEPA